MATSDLLLVNINDIDSFLIDTLRYILRRAKSRRVSISLSQLARVHGKRALNPVTAAVVHYALTRVYTMIDDGFSLWTLKKVDWRSNKRIYVYKRLG